MMNDCSDAVFQGYFVSKKKMKKSQKLIWRKSWNGKKAELGKIGLLFEH
jgi:hypothetical protein